MATDTLDIWRTASEAAWTEDEPGETTPGALLLPRATEPDGGERYLDRGPLSSGGMGEVRLVWDRRLGRLLARKILSGRLSATAWHRFTTEARLTARLDHPGVVPVYDFGVLPDGRPWFTMKKVEGTTLTEQIARIRLAGARGLRRLVSALHRASEAIAYAHEQGVLHRDLKPDNIMVGAFGQVYVVDWGIARLSQTLEIEPDRPGQPASMTRAGAVFGTPQYMAPEQAAGQNDAVGPATDVYGLGATLWHTLTGRPPHAGRSSADILAHLRTLPAPPTIGAPPRGQPALPAELRDLCAAAMAPDPADRPADAAAFAAALADWLDGARREEEAMALVHRARELQPVLAAYQADAATCRARAREILADLPRWAPVAEKAAAWALEDEAAALSHKAELAGIEATQLLRSALTSAPDLLPAHQMLADRYRQLHAEALQAGDGAAALRHEALLRRHDRGRHTRWLDGLGAMSLQTDPPGAAVTLLRYEEQQRRLVPVDTGIRLTTPVQRHALPAGSYLALLSAPGRAEVRYPLDIPRGGHWSGTRPGSSALHAVPLPPAESLGPGDCYVPAGYAMLGHPRGRNGLPRQRVWIDGFVIRRHPVTNREFLAFLNDLLAQGQEDEALRWVPRENTSAGGSSRMVYGRAADGTFQLVPDGTGDVWHPEWPVVLVTWAAARAWCRWEAARTGEPWRLPWELEREKATVGADGRHYSWGNTAESTWSRNSKSSSGRSLLTEIQNMPVDRSPYDVSGLSGNCRDWCLDARADTGPPIDNGCWLHPAPPTADATGWRVFRGGAWATNISEGRAGHRLFGTGDYRRSSLGFRAARSLSPG